METRASYAIIGASLIAGVIAFAAFVLWLGHVQFNKEYAMYNVVFDGAVNGLSEGGQVRYLGINVGEVVDLSLDKENPHQVVARIRIDGETPVRTDSKAILDFAGLTGVTFIQIKPGSGNAALMPKRTGTVGLPVIQAEQTQLAELFDGGQDLIATAQITLAQINNILDRENADSLKVTLSNIEKITGAFAEDEKLLADAAEALAALTRAGNSVGDAANSLGDMGGEAKAYIQELLTNTKLLFGDARKAVQKAEATVDETGKAFKESRTAVQEPTIDAIDEVRLMAQDLRLLIRRIDKIAQEVEQNPQAFIQGTPKPYKEK